MQTSNDKPPQREPPLNKPDHIPFEPTPEKIPRIENWFRHAFAKSAFNVTAAPMPSMQGPKMKIHLHPGTKDCAHPNTSAIPLEKECQRTT